MKLNKIFWALMVVALPLSFTACSSSDDDGVNNDTTPYTYQTPKNKAAQGKYVFPINNNTYEGYASVSLDANKTIAMKFPKKQSLVKAFTRTEGQEEFDYLFGDYVKAGNVYTIYVGGAKWGTVTITSSNGKYYIKIEPVKTEDADMQVSDVEADKAKTVEQSDDTDKLCRTWRPIGIRILVLEKGKAYDTSKFKAVNECSFEAVKKAAADENCTIDEEFGDGYLMTAVSFNNAGDMTIKFNEEKNSYVANWSWKNKDAGANPRYINTTWSKKQSNNTEDNQFIPNEASILYQTGNFKGECWVQFRKDIESNDKKTYDVTLIVRLRDMAE